MPTTITSLSVPGPLMLPTPTFIGAFIEQQQQIIMTAFTQLQARLQAEPLSHSLADISKAQRLLGYAPTQRIGQGLDLAMPWYINH